MNLRNLFKKWKIKLKSFILVTILTVVEIGLVLLIAYLTKNWETAFAIIPTLVQYIMIFEKRDVWERLTDKEKEEIMLSEDDVSGLILGIEKLIGEGKTGKEVLDEIKGS